MAKPLMSDAEIRRRKKLQGHISQTTSTLGLTGLGLLGAGAALKKKPGMLKKLPKYSAMSDKQVKRKATNLGEASTKIGVVSGGVGGIGGYNFAAYTNAESRKRKQGMSTVRKSEDLLPTSGEEGIAKAWEPVSSKADPERSRKRRAEVYAPAAAGLGVAGGTAAGYRSAELGGRARRGYHQAAQTQANAYKLKSTKKKGAGAGARALLGESKALSDAARVSHKASTRTAVLGLGSMAAGAAGHRYLKKKSKSSSWESYSKSAFGVTHD